jgi:hypothetical protein
MIKQYLLQEQSTGKVGGVANAQFLALGQLDGANDDLLIHINTER